MPRDDDRCPFSRSFSVVFAEQPSCPAFHLSTFVVTDMGHRPLGEALTCRHLGVGSIGVDGGRFYPRCTLGTLAQRLRWTAVVTPSHLDVMRALEEQLEAELGPERAELVAAKARALHGRDDDAVLLEELEALLGRFLDHADRVITAQAARLADVGLAPEAMRQLLHAWSLAWLRSREVFHPTIADLPMTGVVPAAAALLGAELPLETGSAVGTGATGPGGPAVEWAEDPPRVALRGEIDGVTADTLLAQALAGGGTGDVVVDFSDVLFCDVSGLRAMVIAAGDGASGRRLVLRNVPAQLVRVMRLVGWVDLPGLLVEQVPYAQDGGDRH